MAYQVGTYKSAFWETDFLSHVGFNTLSSHMKTGQKNTKSIEEYLKLRVKAEEDYSKTLLRISKWVFCFVTFFFVYPVIVQRRKLY